MEKIPFDIKYRPQIESGEYRVETQVGCPVRIVCWDMACELPILGLVLLNDEKAEEMAVGFTNEGTNLLGEPLYDKLFIITPEEELTEFENAFGRAMMEVPDPEEKEEWYPFLKERASELLALAREQFIKDGYVIEKKAFRDAVENISDKHLAEMSVEYSLHCKIEEGTRHAIMNWEAFQKVAQKFIDIGKAEALRTHSTELTENLAKSGLDKDSIPYHLIEFMCNLYTCQNWKEIEETAEAYATRIKAAALKDLPRWKISLPEPGKRYVLLFNGGSIVESRDYRRGNFYYEDGEQYKNIEYNPKCVRWMYAEELYQLPGGFKED